MSRYLDASRAGTIVRLPDGREGTVVYNGLDGIGIVWGQRELSEEDIAMLKEGTGGLCDTTEEQLNRVRQAGLVVEAMLHDPPDLYSDTECVGDTFEILHDDGSVSCVEG